MRKRAILALIALWGCVLLASGSGFEAGLRNTRFIFASYTLKGHYRFKVEHSIFAEKISRQQIRLGIGYTGTAPHLGYEAEATASTSWDGDYRTAGACASLTYTPWHRLHVCGRLNPLYDTSYGYTTCFSLGAGFDLIKTITLVGAYTTIPDYRRSERRVHVGADFHYGPLTARPVLSIAVDGPYKYTQIRVLADISYKF